MASWNAGGLEEQVALWRTYLRRRRTIHSPDVEELEAHLRDQVAALVDAGLAADEAAGHGPRETRRVVGAMGDIPMPEGIKSYKDLRRHCLTCAETIPEVRHCTIIDCPIWPYRMGRNPHNPKRGINPFKVVDAIA